MIKLKKNLDVFMLMDDDFDVFQWTGEIRLLFDYGEET